MPSLPSLRTTRKPASATAATGYEFYENALYDLTIALDALRWGASDYLIKPAKPQQIADIVRKNLRSQDRGRQVLAQNLLAKFICERADTKNAVDRVHEIFEVIGLKQIETQEHSRRVVRPGT